MRLLCDKSEMTNDTHWLKSHLNMLLPANDEIFKNQILAVFLKLIIKISMFKDYSKGIKYASVKKKKRKNKTKCKQRPSHTHTHTHTHTQIFLPTGRPYLRLCRRLRRQAVG